MFAKLAVGVDRRLQDAVRQRRDRNCNPRSPPQRRNMSAPYFSASAFGASTLPSDLDIFMPFSSTMKPWVTTAL